VPRIADRDGREGRGEQVEEAFVDGRLDEDTGAGAAVLARVVQEGHGGGGRRALQVGVREDDVRALTAEFQGQPLHLARTAGHDLLADPGGAGEDDLGNARVVDECRTRDGARPGQHLEESVHQARLQGELRESERGERGGLGGLEQHGVARGECRRGGPGRDGHGEVPRRDDADHAERFQEGDVEPAGHRDLPAGQPLHSAGRVVEQIADVAGLPAGVADDMPGLGYLQQGQLFAVRVDGGGETPQQPGAIGGGQARPGALGGLGPDDGGVHITGGGGGDGGDDLFGGGVADEEVVGGCFGVRRVRGGGRGHGGPHGRSGHGGLTGVRRSGAAPSR
jgi:hypothetical protein